MPKVVSVDAAIRENMPYIEFRGRFYRLRDFTIREQVEQILEFKERQEKAEAEREAALKAVQEAEEEEEAEDGGPDLEELRANADEAVARQNAVFGEAFARTLEDFPAELAEDMTEREIKVMQAAIQEAREVTFPVSAHTQDAPDPNLVGREAVE